MLDSLTAQWLLRSLVNQIYAEQSVRGPWPTFESILPANLEREQGSEHGSRFALLLIVHASNGILPFVLPIRLLGCGRRNISAGG